MNFMANNMEVLLSLLAIVVFAVSAIYPSCHFNKAVAG